MFEPVRSMAVNLAFVAVALILSVIIIALLHSLAPGNRRWVIVALTFLAGLYFPLEFFIPKQNFLTPWRDPVANLVRLMTAFTFGLGVVNLVIIHGRHILRRTANLPFSIAFFVGFVTILSAGLLQQYAPELWAANPKPGAMGVLGFWEASYRLLFEGALQALNATVFSLLAFFIVSAAYRAFRIRTLEAGLLMVMAIVVMLANVPIGQQWITGWIPEKSWWHWMRLENLAHWLQTQINSPAIRAILFGLYVGALGMALRIILSLERTFTVGGQ